MSVVGVPQLAGAARPAAALRGLARHRFAVLGAAAAALALAARAGSPADSAEFARLGRALLHGRLGEVYADDFNQSGPLQLVANALVGPSGLLLHVGGNLAVLAALVAGSRVCRRAVGLAPSPVAELLVGLVCVLWIIPGADFWTGHLAGLAVPCAWVAAAEAARRGNPYAAGAVLGLSAAVEPWGVLACGVLLLCRRPPDVVRAAGAAAAVTVAAYAPFALSGRFALFDHVWPVNDGSVIHQLWPGAEEFSWELRMAQAAVSALACAAAVLLLRRRPGAAVWLAPLAAVLFRLLLDPVAYSYYWVPVQLLVLVGVSTLAPGCGLPRVAACLVLAYVPFARVGPPGAALVATIAALGCVLAGARRARDNAGMADNDLELCAEWAGAKDKTPPDAERLSALTAGYLARREEEIAAKADLDADGLRALAEAREDARRGGPQGG